jgi:aldose sugar dehydrogenase
VRARLTTSLLVVVVLLLGAAGCGRIEPAFTITSVQTQLDRPWDIAFLPSGDMLFTERVGRINLLIGGQKRVLATPADVAVLGEGGMMGLAVDPSFASNRRIYTCFRSNLTGTADVRVVRWQINDANTALTNRVDILTGIPGNSAGIHQGCRIRFAPNSSILWVTTGDAVIGTGPQDPNSFSGKVLRITTDGAPAPGNAGGAFRPEICTYGHRNVQGLAFDPLGRAYSIEHGSDRDDEVNLLVCGGNYGRDPHGPGSTAYDDAQPMTDLVKFPNARKAIWSSGSPTIAPSGGTFISGDQWAGWKGALAIAVLKGNQVRVMALDGSGTSLSQEWIRVTDHGRLRSIVQGPDGSLYVATDATPGEIFKITPN